MIPAGQHLKVMISVPGVYTQTLADEPHIFQPLLRDSLNEPHNVVILVTALEQAQVAVHARNETVYLILTAAAAEGGQHVTGAAQSAVIHVDTVYLDVHTQECDTLTPVLTVELVRMHHAAYQRQSAAEFRQHGQHHLLVVSTYHNVINETDIMKPTLINSPVVQIVQIVVHGVLPDEMADSTSDAGRFLKQTLALGNVHPLPYRCAAGAVPCRIGEYRYLKDVVHLVEVGTVIAAEHQFFQETERIVLSGVGEITLKVQLYVIRVTGIAVAHVIHILYDFVDGGILAVTLAVVIGAGGQFHLYERPHADIQIVMEQTQGEAAGKDLAGFGIAAYEGIGGRPEGVIVYISLDLTQVTLPVQLKLNRVGRVALVFPGAQHGSVQIFQCNHRDGTLRNDSRRATHG